MKSLNDDLSAVDEHLRAKIFKMQRPTIEPFHKITLKVAEKKKENVKVAVLATPKQVTPIILPTV